MERRGEREGGERKRGGGRDKGRGAGDGGERREVRGGEWRGAI